MNTRLLAAFATFIFTGPALAAGVPGYLTDSQDAIVHNNYGECWHTGSWTPEMAVVGCDGKVAEAAPAPEPMPAPREIQEVTLSADALFAFDRADLKPGAVEALDNLVSQIKGYDDVERVRITGHADRIGSDAYNMRLSQRRAESVKGYLVRQGAISADKIEAQGVGESQPVVACEGVKKRAALIKCLAPNRRVVIDVDVKKMQ
jgi:OOP family OmpA-OmpF porin